MPNKAYARGSRLEREARLELEGQGWVVSKAGGSKGSYDLMCMKAGQDNLLVQVKGDKSGPFAHFGPTERKRLLGDASAAGAVAWLVWDPGDRKGRRWIPSSEWP